MFAGFRLFDIVKPWPISRPSDSTAGLGIMADDMLAGFVTALLVYLAWLVNLFP